MMPNRFYQIIFVVFMLPLLWSCGEQPQQNFTVSGQLINGRVAQTAYLYEFLPQYETIRMIDSASVKNNRFHFIGVCNERKPAFVKLDNDKEALNFFLSNNDLKITIGKNSYAVAGTNDNYHLSKIINLQHRAVNERIKVQKKYSQLVADSTLTKQLEDSLASAYARPSKELRKLILSEITANMDSDKMFSAMCLRLFSAHISSSEVDSLSLLLNIPKVGITEHSK